MFHVSTNNYRYQGLDPSADTAGRADQFSDIYCWAKGKLTGHEQAKVTSGNQSNWQQVKKGHRQNMRKTTK